MPSSEISPPNANPASTSAREAVPSTVLEAEQLARSLADVVTPQAVRGRQDSPRLLQRLQECEATLQKVYHHFAQAPKQEIALSYAAEWLLDNYYVIEQAIRQIHEDLPLGYYRELPLVADGPLAGFPRIYAIAVHVVNLPMSELDPEVIRQFVIAFQEAQPLRMGELWALPIMLRMALLERLTTTVASVITQPAAQGQPPDTPAEGVAVGYCITSLRRLAVQDWKVFVESVSLVEYTLRTEPAGVYVHMDFDTRNQYRKVIEDLAKATGIDENVVALEAVRRASITLNVNHGTPQSRRSHVGYYLLDEGYRGLEEHFGYHAPWPKRLGRWALAHSTFTYLMSILLVTLLVVATITSYATEVGAAWVQMLVVTILGLVPASTAAISLVNWIVTRAVQPRTLPRLDFEAGIPAECRTFIVVPTLLTHSDEIDELTQQLELHYLRNTDPHLCFALLSDFEDAPQKDMPGDTALVEHAAEVIRLLNDKYAQSNNGPFYLLHRERQWNPSEGIWMGWERKRGKLAELNCLLRDCGETSFTIRVGDLDVLRHVRYVITLDADTILQRGDASRLISTLAHPLNQAEFAPDRQTVIAGYTILQPRTEIKPTISNKSLFTRIFAGDIGLDPYTHAVSDVYQDLFDEGIYVGKGIYDVDAFEMSLHGRVPENRLLSHDLFEGIHGRAGLVTDIVLLEDYPPHYIAYALRQHRWTRGDWQLLPWLMPLVPHMDGSFSRSVLSPIDLWKILDNLRRSLLAPALLTLLILAWLWLPGAPFIWSLGLAATLAVPVLTSAISTIASSFTKRRPDTPLSIDVRPVWLDALRWLLAFTFLPFEALLALDAILTTLLRLLIIRRNLLQWTTASLTARMFGDELKPEPVYQQMLVSLVVVLALLGGVALLYPSHLGASVPWLILWLLSPQIAFWISLPTGNRVETLTDEERQWLRCLSRRTWLFFEHFVGPDDNWLPPDHFQESPLGAVVHQTSPTNLGMLLLSTLAAYDLGYIRRIDMTVRLHATFTTMARLERYRGHFLNWYDTRTLTPLPPAYVSTVDSGNLAACLLALRQGCLRLADAPVMRWERWEGLIDIIELLRTTVNTTVNTAVNTGAEASSAQVTSRLDAHLEHMRQRILAVRERQTAWMDALTTMIAEDKPFLDELILQYIEPSTPDTSAPDVNTLGYLRTWMERLNFHLTTMQEEWSLLLPWFKAIAHTPALFERPRYQQSWQLFTQILPLTVSVRALPAFCNAAQVRLAELRRILDTDPASGDSIGEARAWCEQMDKTLTAAQSTVEQMLQDYENLVQQAETYVLEMDFRFLFNAQREVFHIGYNMVNSRLDNNYYDLLASEARIGSMLAIAKGDVPASHWLHLGRPLTKVSGQEVLLSWSGTMFEYLMPPLLLRNYPGTLLDETCAVAVRAQMDYAKQRHIPWGISESGYYAFDSSQNYQYRAFGVPSLGYKRGLGEDLVVAPYASILALGFTPREVIANLYKLTQLRALGSYGFYDAIDFTEARIPPGSQYGIVKSYLAHHQGMSLLALSNFLRTNSMVERLHTDPRIVSAELLLQEKLPVNAPIEHPHAAERESMLPGMPPITIASWEVPANPTWPIAHVLSHGRYGLIITSAGSGYSQWQGIALTRWNADPTLEDTGMWVYIQENRDGRWSLEDTWSATLQPMGVEPEQQHVLFHAHKVEFQRTDRGISTHTEITVVPEDDVEVRRITLTNNSDEHRRLRLTSYGEVVLAPQAADQRHPAFSKLFVESKYVSDVNALIFRRRPRSAIEKSIYLLHALILEPDHKITGACECDRGRFLGRGHNLRAPIALSGDSQWLSGTTGATLDPIMSLGQEIELEPHAQVQLAYITLVATTQSDAVATARQYHTWQAISHVFDHARAQADLDLRRRNFGTPELETVQLLLSALLYPRAALRASPDVLASNIKGQSGLWAYGISGDYPIVLVRVSAEGAPIITELLQAHAYWRDRQITVNIVFLNERDTTYDQALNSYLYRVLTSTGNGNWLNRRDGIFILRADQMNTTDLTLLQTVARAIFDASKGTLAEQLRQAMAAPAVLPAFVPVVGEGSGEGATVDAMPKPMERPRDLLFDNGTGGFSADGKEYVIYLPQASDAPAKSNVIHCLPPAPWSNVIANPQFGFLISEAGSSCTWAQNSGENRLTSWNNDPVTDTSPEAIYLRDEENAVVWSPTPLPAGAPAPYLVRHGAGYSIFEHISHDLHQRLRIFSPPEAAVKIMQLEVRNLTGRPRRLTATYYAEWVLGTTADAMRQFVVPEFDAESHTLLAQNTYNAEFGRAVAFATASQRLHSLTADRTEFLGRHGTIHAPAGLGRIGLSGTVQAGLDPCAAIQVHMDLGPHETQQVHFVIGQGADREEALQLARHYTDAVEADAAWDAAQRAWEDLLGTVTVHTPDLAMDLMLNRWLLYQSLSCRVWGRTALYQSSGAYGFRDQLQDVMALVHTAPQVARAHLMNAAQRQFEAGDVLHWWHPPLGRGIRTRCSDDLLWLPFVTAYYVEATGDHAILDEKLPFLRGDPLRPGEDERYGQFDPTPYSASLYEHCQRALKKGNTAGPHGLPLIASGDWNDGMNRVGIEGRGESIWLGWFLYTTLQRFAGVCDGAGDTQAASMYREQSIALRNALHLSGWDGQWYRRAYYDDGTPLGSSQNSECQIDSIAETWAVISGAAPLERAQQAMQAVEDLLVRRNDRLVLLFTPPFDKTTKDPGYIRGYVPGIRENGGQYTHGATWVGWAYAQLGDGDKATDLFQMLNPINHSDTDDKVSRYRVEPYVVVADIYSVPPHTGRGGWTWYTGSASWMYRLGIEAILGIYRVGSGLRIAPRIPKQWAEYEVNYRYGGTQYHIRIINSDADVEVAHRLELDGHVLEGDIIPLSDDGGIHQVIVHL